jgi:PAS domain S-box-containing protein
MNKHVLPPAPSAPDLPGPASVDAQRELEGQAAILDALPANVALINANGFIVSVNAAWREFAAANQLVSEACAVGVNYLDVCDAAHGADAAAATQVSDGIRQVLNGELTDFSSEYPCHSPQEKRWFQLHVSPIAQGDLNGAVVMHTNVTALREERERSKLGFAELNTRLKAMLIERTQALVRQEALFKTLADQAPAMIWTLNAEATHITYINRTGAQLLGAGADALIGSVSQPFIHPADREATGIEKRRAALTKSTFVNIRRLQVANGSYRTMSCRASPVLDAQGEVEFWVGIDVDITELKDVEAALRISHRELETFSYAVAHDLRSPLAVIDGFSRLLEKELGESATPRATHLLARIRAGVTQMDEVATGLLSLSGISRISLALELTDISKIAHEVASLLKDQAADRHVELYIQDGMTAFCDRRLLRAMLANLLGNAWKFTAHTANAKISFTASPDPAMPGFLVYRIQDNGAGFDMAHAANLFTPFQRLHSAQQFEGTGIGLATAKKIVQRHGGWITATAEPGRGATFDFSLGAHAAAAGVPQAAPQAAL